MSDRITDWLDARLGYRQVLAAARKRTLPNGPGWAYASASCLLWLLVIECLTGLALMATYSPSMTSAWASVHFIDKTAAGSFLRGIHHYASHALIILLALHVARVLIAGAYRAPREVVWITGLLLIPLVIVWTVTGNPLSGSQKGTAQIEVEANILGSTPYVGPLLQRLLIGGDEFGNLTLTHLYFLHVGLLPLLVGGLAALHLHQVYRHSECGAKAGEGSVSAGIPYWPYQSVCNLAALTAIIGGLGYCAWRFGAPLDFPADPELVSMPRPEWYFRWLFELRRHFTGDTEFIATMIIPGAILLFFLAVPFLEACLSRRVALVFRLTAVVVSLGGWSWLTWQSFSRDWGDAEYLAAQEQAHQLSIRARTLANEQAISIAGAGELLRNDPHTQGPLLFAKHCASCHSYTSLDGHGIAAAEVSAPNLYGIGRAEWIQKFLDPQTIAGPEVFGHTKFREGDMVGTIQSLFDDASEDGRAVLLDKLNAVVVALAAEGAEASQTSTTDSQEQTARGRELISSELSCTDCHRFRETGELGTAPDLTGYGSAEWLTGMIANPQAERFYGGDRNDRMPQFAADPMHPSSNLLSQRELDLLVRWLRDPAK